MDEDLTTVGVLEKLIWEEAFQIEKEEGYSKVEWPHCAWEAFVWSCMEWLFLFALHQDFAKDVTAQVLDGITGIKLWRHSDIR